jgi:hypothetical protein
MDKLRDAGFDAEVDFLEDDKYSSSRRTVFDRHELVSQSRPITDQCKLFFAGFITMTDLDVVWNLHWPDFMGLAKQIRMERRRRRFATVKNRREANLRDLVKEKHVDLALRDMGAWWSVERARDLINRVLEGETEDQDGTDDVTTEELDAAADAVVAYIIQRDAKRRKELLSLLPSSGVAGAEASISSRITSLDPELLATCMFRCTSGWQSQFKRAYGLKEAMNHHCDFSHRIQARNNWSNTHCLQYDDEAAINLCPLIKAYNLHPATTTPNDLDRVAIGIACETCGTQFDTKWRHAVSPLGILLMRSTDGY